MPREIHIRFDWAMKRLLRQKANFVVLEGFLSELLKFDVIILEILESEGNKEHEYDKFNRVDLLAKDDKGDLILIEVQNEREHDYFHRMNYGQAKLVTEHIKAGETYGKIKKVFSINIVYFELGQGKDYIYFGKTDFKGIHDQDFLQLSKKQKELYSIENVSDIFANYYIIKVNNFNDIAKDTLDEWVYFLKNSEIKDGFVAKGLSEAKEKLRIDSLRGTEKVAYDQYIKDQRIRTSEIETAVFDAQKKLEKKMEKLQKQAEEECRQKEEAKKREEEERRKRMELQRNSALELKKLGLSVDKIAQITGLLEDEIINLQ